jgi:hypothetical protein
MTANGFAARALPIITVQCMSCSRFVYPGDIMHIGESVTQCWDCYQRIATIVESFAEPPGECALCNTKFEDLAARDPGKPVSMFPHEIEGTIGFLCRPCERAYVLKRRDLYGKTRFGQQRGL